MKISALALSLGFLPLTYIGVPPETLGKLCRDSTHVVAIRVARVDRVKGVVVFHKIKALKGDWPETIVHSVAEHRIEHDAILNWAEPGKTTVQFALSKPYYVSHTYIDTLWYPAYLLGVENKDKDITDLNGWKFWGVTQLTVDVPPPPGGVPSLLRDYSGKAEKLPELVEAILGGREVIVPCREDGPAADLRALKTRVQRLRASLQRLDYNPKRDFVGWGEEEGK